MPYNAVDLLVDEDGDLELASNGDLTLATEIETIQQDVLFRLKTMHRDYIPNPYVGADLVSFIGEPNNERTAAYIKVHIITSLTHDNRIKPTTLYVEIIPIAIDKVHVVVIITDRVGDTATNVVVTQVLNLEVLGPGDESILGVDE